jgi:DNA-binding transcriptional LysR family regulator
LPVNLASLDLNLLMVFRAVMAHRSVTRAGREIGLSQPAMSNALARLRHYYKDPLFLRGPAGMEPTVRARELSIPIFEALAMIERNLPTADAFDPMTIERRFNLGLVDYGGIHLVAALVSILAREAPGIEIVTSHMDGNAGVAKLNRAEIDLAVGVLPDPPVDWLRRDLLIERSVVTVRDGHPRIQAPPTLEMYAKEQHVRVSRFNVVIDKMLAKQGLARQFTVSADLLSVPFIVARSDLVATLPSGIARTFSSLCKLRSFDLPSELPHYRIALVRHPRSASDGQLAWLSQCIERAAKDMDQVHQIPAEPEFA